MTDFEYDVLQKKKAARGSFHKVSGARSKKCSLPTDYMSARQLKNMNGDVHTVELGKPISYTEFKKLPESLGIEYITHIIKTYKANYTWISEMFGCSVGTVRNILSAPPYNIKIKRGGRNSDIARKEWLEFISGDDTKVSETASESSEQDKIPIEVEAEKIEAETTTPKSERPKMQFRNCSLEFSGKFDTGRILNTLNAIVVDGCNVTVKIDVSFEEGDGV